MLFLLSFLMFFGAATTGLLLAVDSLYARAGLDWRLEHAHHAHGRHWSPQGEALIEDPAAGASMLPPGVRPRLWGLFAASFIAGCVLRVLAL